MPTVASRLTSTGTLFISGEFNEVAGSAIKLTTTTYYASKFDEVSIHGGGIAKRETNTGTILVSGEFNEVLGFIVADGLVGYYNAGKSTSRSATGSAWYDISTLKINAIPDAGAAAPTFNTNGYFVFDRINSQRFTVASAPMALTSWSQPWTIGVWMYVPSAATWSDGVNQSHFVSKGTTAGSWGIVRGSTVNAVHAFVRTDSGVTQTNGTITRDAWQNVIGTWDGVSNLKTYINGVLIDTAIATISGVPDTQELVIGGSPTAVTGSPGTFYEGYIGAVMMYNRELSASEVDNNFQVLRTQFGI